jgi:hypothetical protein
VLRQIAVTPFMNQGNLRHRRQSFSFGIHLLAGAVGVLAGLQHLLSARDRTKAVSNPARRAAEASSDAKEDKATRRDYFSIRRTKSELGYVYWVLQGHGAFQCFVLFDRWKEAAAEASRRVSERCAESVSGLSATVDA